MFDSPIRRAKDRIAAPLAARMTRISPNAMTLLALAVGLAAAVLAARRAYLWAIGFGALNRALDGMDGLLARVNNRQSDFGGYLDILLDFVVYAAIPLGMVLGAPSQTRYLALSFMLATFYINSASWMYLAAILEKRNAQNLHAADNPEVITTIVMPTGLVGGLETVLAYCAFLLFPPAMAVIFSVFGILVLVTIVQRLIWAWRALR